MSEICEYSLDQVSNLIATLEAHLPTSLALYRRLQFQHFTSTSHIFSSLVPSDLEKRDSARASAPWIAAYVDRSRRPETEVWIYGSWEHDANHDQAEAADLLKSLFAKIRAVGLTGTTDEPTRAGTVQEIKTGSSLSKDSATKVGRGEYEGHLANPSIVLFGAVHEKTVELMRDVEVLSPEFVGADIPYRKYLIDMRYGPGMSIAYSMNYILTTMYSSKTIEDVKLAEGLVWGKVRSNHFELVRSRTQIPRQDKTLRELPSLAIFPRGKAEPIAWSFLGPDASLSSLHVEPEYRGHGLAKKLATKLFAEEMSFYGKDGHASSTAWAHADVAVDNVASNGVCKGLGGKWKYHVYWVRVDTSVGQ